MPVAVYLAAGWLVNTSGRGWRAFRPELVTIGLLLAAAFLLGAVTVSLAVLGMGVVVAGTVGVSAYRWSRQAADDAPVALAPTRPD